MLVVHVEFWCCKGWWSSWKVKKTNFFVSIPWLLGLFVVAVTWVWLPPRMPVTIRNTPFLVWGSLYTFTCHWCRVPHLRLLPQESRMICSYEQLWSIMQHDWKNRYIWKAGWLPLTTASSGKKCDISNIFNQPMQIWKTYIDLVTYKPYHTYPAYPVRPHPVEDGLNNTTLHHLTTESERIEVFDDERV